MFGHEIGMAEVEKLLKPEAREEHHLHGQSVWYLGTTVDQLSRFGLRQDDLGSGGSAGG